MSRGARRSTTSSRWAQCRRHRRRPSQLLCRRYCRLTHRYRRHHHRHRHPPRRPRRPRLLRPRRAHTRLGRQLLNLWFVGRGANAAPGCRPPIWWRLPVRCGRQLAGCAAVPAARRVSPARNLRLPSRQTTGRLLPVRPRLRAMVTWRCPHCRTVQGETARCFLCRPFGDQLRHVRQLPFIARGRCWLLRAQSAT